MPARVVTISLCDDIQTTDDVQSTPATVICTMSAGDLPKLSPRMVTVVSPD